MQDADVIALDSFDVVVQGASGVTKLMTTTLVHLVRHAEVHNPENVWYGRLEGYRLSERGLRQVEALAEYFAGHPIKAVYSSPMERALQTSEPIAARHGLTVKINEDLIESMTKLEGRPGDMRVFRNPLNARHFINPWGPSWGESYRSTADRMLRAIARMRAEHEGGEVIAVSHMTPVLVARLRIEGNPRPPWRAGLPCRRASVTTLTFKDGEYSRTHYEPVGSAVV